MNIKFLVNIRHLYKANPNNFFTEEQLIENVELILQEYLRIFFEKQNIYVSLHKINDNTIEVELNAYEVDEQNDEESNEYYEDLSSLFHRQSLFNTLKETLTYLQYYLHFFKTEKDFIYYKRFHLKLITGTIIKQVEDGFWLSFKPVDVFPLVFENEFAKKAFYESKNYHREYKMFLPFILCSYRDVNYNTWEQTIGVGDSVTCFATQIKPNKRVKKPYMYLVGNRISLRLPEMLLLREIIDLANAEDYIFQVIERNTGKETVIHSNLSIPVEIIRNIRQELHGESIKVRYGEEYEMKRPIIVKDFLREYYNRE